MSHWSEKVIFNTCVELCTLLLMFLECFYVLFSGNIRNIFLWLEAIVLLNLLHLRQINWHLVVVLLLKIH